MSSRRPGRPHRRPLWLHRLGAVATLLILGVLTTQAPAFAHASLIGSDPVQGATLAQPPASARLSLSDPVDPQFVSVSLTDQDGGHPQLPAPSVAQNEVTQALPELANGGYTLAYRIVSADGHPVTGQLQFAVSANTPAPAPDAPPAPQPASATQPEGASWGLWTAGVAGVAVLIAGIVITMRRLGRDD